MEETTSMDKSRHINSADALAKEVSKAMFEKDKASKHLGMKIVKVSAGYARLSFKIEEYMLNGHGICHGGYLYSLADSAFAFASNSYNIVAVAYGCDILYTQPGKKDMLCIAEAKQLHIRGRNGVFDVCIKTEQGLVLAYFRGKARYLKHRKILENLDSSLPEEA